MADKITKKRLAELEEKEKELETIKKNSEEKDEGLKKGDLVDEDEDEDEDEESEEYYCSDCGKKLVSDKLKKCPHCEADLTS